MKLAKLFFNLIVVLLLAGVGMNGYAQPLPCPPINTTTISAATSPGSICAGISATLTSVSSTTVKSTNAYTYSTIPYLPTSFTGGTPVLVGIDDAWSNPVPLPFDFCFYGTKYTQCWIGANGEITFTPHTPLISGGCPWAIGGPWPTYTGDDSAVLNSIMGAYYDIDPSEGSGTIKWAVYGTAPCRTFVVSWYNIPLFNAGFCPGLTGTQQIVLYESTYAIDIFIHHKPPCTAWNSGLAILGIIDATGANYNIPSWYNATVYAIDDSGYRFTPNGPAVWTYTWTGPGGIPVGFTPTITVTPGSGSNTYTVTGIASSNCDSYTVTATASVNVFPVPAPILTSTNPTLCGNYDGTITLHGLTPGAIDTVNYSKGGLAQPTLYITVSAGGTIMLTGLCADSYTNIVVKEGFCSSLPASVTLTDPAISIGSVNTSDPSLCNAADGTLTLLGLLPGHPYTVNYNYAGAPQPPIPTSSSATGTILLNGLCAGTYDNIVVSYPSCTGFCTSPRVGPFTLSSPPISISSVTPTNPTACGVCDGIIVLDGLYPGHAFTISYNLNGAAQPPLSVSTSSTGSVTISGLCAGTYDNFVASFTGTCETCTTPAFGTATLTYPPPVPINIVGFTQPTECGLCNGSIKIKPVFTYTSDTVSYAFNTIPQLPSVTFSLPDSSIYFTGLCPGEYTGFQVKVGPCLIPVIGSAILDTPQLHLSFTDAIHYGCPKDTVLFTNWSTNPTPLSYMWSFGDSIYSAATSPSHIYNQGTYTVTMVGTNHYCTDSVTKTLNLVNPLRAGFTYRPATGLVCQKQPLTFADSSAGIGRTFAWSFGDGNTSTDQNPVYTYNNSGSYHVRLIITDFVPCSDTTTSTIYVDSIAQVRLAVSDSVFCRNTGVTLEGHYTNIGLTGVTWDFGDGDSILNVNPVSHDYNPGTYNATITTHYRVCRDTTLGKSLTIFAGPGINIGNDTSICPGGNSIVLKDFVNEGNPRASWLWNTGQTGNSIVVSQPGQYYAIVNINNCDATDTVWVANDCYINIPNVFSPNGDGINDYFFPRQYLTMGLTTFKMDIYNRWGQLIFESQTLDGRGWDGRFNDIQQPEGVYIYVIDATFKDGQKEHHQGNVTLLR